MQDAAFISLSLGWRMADASALLPLPSLPPLEPAGSTLWTSGPYSISSYRDESQLDSITALISADLSEPYSIFTYRHFVAGWPEFTLLAHCDGKLVGAVICKSDLRPRTQRIRGYVAMLAVEKEHRRAGLGRQLAVHVLRRMAASCDELVLETEVSNTPALKLYESLGFVKDKRLSRYYLHGADGETLSSSSLPKRWWPSAPSAATQLCSAHLTHTLSRARASPSLASHLLASCSMEAAVRADLSTLISASRA
jgi:peptide alpha-N-acetyltransferase